MSALKESWGIPPETEVKGSRLNEVQVSSVIDLMLSNRVTAAAVVFDSRFNNDATITAHRIEQARRITRRIDHRFSKEIRIFYQKLRIHCRTMSNQLYVQARILVNLCHECLQLMLIEYPSTHASELGRIEVIVDAKDRAITPYEEFWRIIIMPLLENLSSRKPIGLMRGGDYSHFHRSFREYSEVVPPHLSDLYPENYGPIEYNDLGLIFGRARIEPSHQHVGLQLVDIVANTLTRVFKGNLQSEGWHRFPELFINQAAGALQIAVIGGGGLPATPPPYIRELMKINDGARSASFHFKS